VASAKRLTRHWLVPIDTGNERRDDPDQAPEPGRNWG